MTSRPEWSGCTPRMGEAGRLDRTGDTLTRRACFGGLGRRTATELLWLAACLAACDFEGLGDCSNMLSSSPARRDAINASSAALVGTFSLERRGRLGLGAMARSKTCRQGHQEVSEGGNEVGTETSRREINKQARQISLRNIHIHLLLHVLYVFLDPYTLKRLLDPIHAQKSSSVSPSVSSTKS